MVIHTAEEIKAAIIDDRADAQYATGSTIPFVHKYWHIAYKTLTTSPNPYSIT